jgi:hypothetical protein
MKLNTTRAHALDLVSLIPHKTCANAIQEHWVVSDDGAVRPQSVLWLFCWAKTGMNSESARTEALRVFDEVLPIRFAALDRVVEHKYARDNRYTARDIQKEFEAKIRQLGEPT